MGKSEVLTLYCIAIQNTSLFNVEIIVTSLVVLVFEVEFKPFESLNDSDQLPENR